MGATGSELNALRIVQEEGGETSSHMMSRKMGIDTGYARLLCTSLARADYLDLLTSGKFRITLKGKNALGVILPQGDAKPTARKSPRKGSTIDFDWKTTTKGQQRSPDWESYEMKGSEGQLGWNPIKIDQKGIVYSGRDKTLRETENQCGFCKGKGEKPRGAKCSVCKGKGVISIQPPIRLEARPSLSHR